MARKFNLNFKKDMSLDDLKNVFLGISVIGLIWIALISFIGQEKVPVYLVILLPVLLFAFYVLIFLWSGKPEHLLDLFADSLYYYGFLMTIGSLTFSFLALTGKRGLDPDKVLSVFGIALITTLLGMGGRIYFSHFKFSSDAAEQAAKETLRQKTNHFIIEIEVVTDSMKRLNKRVSRQMDSIDRVIEEKLVGFTENAREELEVLIRSSAASFNKQFEDLAPSMKLFSTELKSMGDKLKEVDLSEDFQKGVLTPLTELVSRFNEIRDAVDSAGEGLKRLTQINEEVADKMDTTLDSLAKTERIANSLKDLSDSFQEAHQSLSRARENLELVAGFSANSREEYAKMAEDLKGEIERVGKLREAVFKEYEDANKAAASMTKTMTDGANFIRKELEK